LRVQLLRSPELTQGRAKPPTARPSLALRAVGPRGSVSPVAGADSTFRTPRIYLLAPEAHVRVFVHSGLSHSNNLLPVVCVHPRIALGYKDASSGCLPRCLGLSFWTSQFSPRSVTRLRVSAFSPHGMLPYPFPRYPSTSTFVEEGGEISSLNPHPGYNGGFEGAGTAQGKSGGIRAARQLYSTVRSCNWR